MNKLFPLLMIFVLCGCDGKESYKVAVLKKDCSLVPYTNQHAGCELNLLNQTLQELLKAQKGI